MTNKTSGRRPKVARVIDQYNLDGMGAQLESAWTGESGERTSLRDLADEFNRAVLEAALREVGGSPPNFEVVGLYEALQAETGPEATRARRELERAGIDPESVSSDFVTHQAIHTYLTKERDASLPDQETHTVVHKIETIQKLEGRLAAVAENAVRSIDSNNELHNQNYNILVDVRAVCPECGSDRPISEFLENKGCECVVTNWEMR